MSQPESSELRLDPADVRVPPPRSPRLVPIIAGGLVGLAAVYGWVWWSQQPPQVVAKVAPLPKPVPDARPSPTRRLPPRSPRTHPSSRRPWWKARRL
jgi:hypothetical protein